MPLDDLGVPDPLPLRWWIDVDPCPPWCGGGHTIGDEPDGWRHTKRIDFDVIRPNPAPDERADEPVQCADAEVRVEREAAQNQHWVRIAIGFMHGRHIVISPQSAAALIPAMVELLTAVPLIGPAPDGVE